MDKPSLLSHQHTVKSTNMSSAPSTTAAASPDATSSTKDSPTPTPLPAPVANLPKEHKDGQKTERVSQSSQPHTGEEQKVTAHTTEQDSNDPVNKDDRELKMSDIRSTVDEMDDNIDQAFGSAAQSIWSLATSVTGTVSSAVGGVAPTSLEQLRDNVTSHLKPLDSISHNLTSKFEAFTTTTPSTDQISSTIAGSMKSMAQTVQKNAQQMERAILSKANGVESESNKRQTGSETASKSKTTDNQQQNKGEHEGTVSIQKVEQEISKVGETLGKTVGGLWNGLWGDDNNESNSSGWERTDGKGINNLIVNKVPTTRIEKKLVELQSDPNTYCEPAQNLDEFEKWGKSFSVDDVTNECIEILSNHNSIAELYERVVPNIVEEDTFWMRYFFAKHVLLQEEQRRQQLLQRAESVGAQAGDDEGWGDDDWGEDEDNADAANTASENETSKILKEEKENDSSELTSIKDPTKAEKNETNKQKEYREENEEKKELQEEIDTQASFKADLPSSKKENKSQPDVVSQLKDSNEQTEGEDDWGDDWE